MQLTHAAKELAGKSGQSLTRIVDIAEHAVGEVLAISEATTEQARTGGMIASAMNEIKDMARQSVSNMSESATFVSELANLSEELKNLVDSMGSERRQEDRLPLELPYSLTLAVPGAAPSVCRLLDISLSGMRLEFQAGGGSALAAEDAVRIQADQAPLANILRNISGQIAWRDGILCGIALDTMLKVSFDELRQLIANFQGT
jgi:hypothetical protein